MNWTVHHGDSLDVLKTLEADSIDSVVTDPPYGLTQHKRGGSGEASLNLNSPAGRSRITTGGGFMGMKWDVSVPSVELWREVFRVLKPGGHVLSFGGTRTYHRMAVAIEDAGFEIRDQLQWLFGSGFPKSMSVDKAIDRAAGAKREVIGQQDVGPDMTGDNYGRDAGARMIADITAPATDDAKLWEGWGTALKPANEPIVLARKPLSEKTVAKNVLTHGTGALNIDASRIDTTEIKSTYAVDGTGWWDKARTGFNRHNGNGTSHVQGRWPSNVILACSCAEGDQLRLIHADDCAVAELDRQSGVTMSTGGSRGAGGQHGRYSKIDGQPDFKPGIGDRGGASRFFYIAKTSKRERNAGLEGMAKTSRSHMASIDGGGGGWAKDSAKNPNLPRENSHPTVKPIRLMEYLIRLVTPPGGTTLDPFTGSGSTGCAAVGLGFSFVGVEREAEYVEIARKRIEHHASKA